MIKLFIQSGKIAMGLVAFASILTSCKDDVVAPVTPVSRLYVSTADTDPAVANLEIYDPADATSITAQVYNTGAKDGNGVATNNDGSEVYQLSRANKTLYVFANNSSLVSSPTASRSFTDAGLSSGREIAYDQSHNTLYIANNTDSTIRVYNNFSTLSGNVAGKVLKVSGQPWGIHYDAAANRLLVLMDLAAMRIEVYNNPSAIAAGVITSNAVFNIADRPNGSTKSRLHGLTYSSSANVLIVTEIGEATSPLIPDPSKPVFNADCGIYVFTDAALKLSSGGTFSANRIIYGAATGLGNPVDVAVDTRPNKNLIYVAEKANKKISAFKLSDNGNVAPTITSATSRAPEALFLYNK